MEKKAFRRERILGLAKRPPDDCGGSGEVNDGAARRPDPPLDIARIGLSSMSRTNSAIW
jgi:hypothetical protein